MSGILLRGCDTGGRDGRERLFGHPTHERPFAVKAQIEQASAERVFAPRRAGR
jgi:hypothetical protein